jgi:8-oxo-dGTP pyrophosphatase MutT (NUDIX family)
MTSSPDEPILRDAARVVLLDAAGRVLLQKWRLQTGGHVWITPGGGLLPGETHREAAIRELSEEIGLVGAELGPWVWAREQVLQWNGRAIRQRERFHLLRVEAHEVDRAGNDEQELQVIEEIRWWTRAEIAASQDDFAPRRLAVLLEALLDGVLPAEPLDVGG